MMNQRAPSIECLIRQAFGLLLEIRRHRQARRLLTLAVAFLKMLIRDAGAHEPPVVVSVRAVRIPKC